VATAAILAHLGDLNLEGVGIGGRRAGCFGVGHELGELNWAHGIACPSEDLIYIADMNNWRVQKLVTKGKK